MPKSCDIAASRPLAVLVAAPVAAQAVSLPEADVAAIEAAIAEEMAAKNLPGVAVGIWIPGRGEYVAREGRGEPRDRRGAERRTTRSASAASPRR